ncbi:MAG: SAM-dependent methyltransferase [Roseibacillus sp.]
MTRFDRFMQAALYHPERGYYTSRIKAVGTRGDFTTTPQLSDILGKAIAHSFLESGLRHLIEIGPGTGLLAKQVCQRLPFLTKLKTQQHLVEVSPPLRILQKENNPKAHHHESIQDALKAAKGEAFIYSNELVDAFPARIFRKDKSGWSELHLSGAQPHLEEHFLPVESLPDSQLFQEDHPLHQRIEIHESYHQWLSTWLPDLTKGQLLTVDYMAPTPRLLSGTLRGYFLQDRLTGPNLYQNAGHIDLTTDVHFDDLEHWGKALGLATLTRTNQHEFLTPFSNKSHPENYLTEPSGAGNAFGVLLQSHSK